MKRILETVVGTQHMYARDSACSGKCLLETEFQSLSHTKHTFYPRASPHGRDLNCRVQQSRIGPACQDQNIVTGIFASKITTHSTFNLSFTHTGQ